MGTQNGSQLEIRTWGILIHALEVKLRPFEVEVLPYVCIGSHAFAMFSTHALREDGAMRTHQRDDHYPLRSELMYTTSRASWLMGR